VLPRVADGQYAEHLFQSEDQGGAQDGHPVQAEERSDGDRDIEVR